MYVSRKSLVHSKVLMIRECSSHKSLLRTRVSHKTHESTPHITHISSVSHSCETSLHHTRVYTTQDTQVYTTHESHTLTHVRVPHKTLTMYASRWTAINIEWVWLDYLYFVFQNMFLDGRRVAFFFCVCFAASAINSISRHFSHSKQHPSIG